MKKNAFTLIELIATIGLLGMLATITITVSVRKINETKEKARDTMIESIKLAAEKYVTDYEEELQQFKNNDNIYISLQTLVEKEYFTESLVDPTTKKSIPITNEVYITRDKNGEISSTYNVNQSQNPKLTLIGSYNEYVEEGKEYVEQGVKAITPSGEDASSSVTITGSVDTTIPNTYKITYELDNVKITRNVIVFSRNLQSDQTNKLIITINNGQTSKVIEKEYIKIRQKNIAYEIKDIDLSNITNVSCNNGAVPTLENNTLDVKQLTKNTTCLVNNSIEETINQLDNSETNIVMLLDEEVDEELEINKENNVIFDLNGKTLTLSDKSFIVYGSLNLLSSDNQGTITSNEIVIRNKENARIEISNTKLISSNQDTVSAICTNGYLEINKNTYIEGPYGIGCHENNFALTIVNDGIIKGKISDAIHLNIGYNSKLIINNGYFYGYQNSISTSANSIININGGTFISETSNSILNLSTGTININTKTTSIYISSLAKEWKPAISNYSTGTINLNGKTANQCTNDYTNTTSGLCVYAEGDKVYTANTSNGAIENYSTGTVNINGGTYYGGQQGINNNFSGIININNGVIKSSRYAILNNSNGIINICNATITGTYDLTGNGLGIMNYSSNVIFTNGNNTPLLSSFGDGANAISNYTGICTN